jgi:hypothetical protein
MICSRCFKEEDLAKPLKFCPTGYLMACRSCYWKNILGNLGIIVATGTILFVAIFGIFLLWNAKIGLGRFGLCFLIAYYSILILRFFLTSFGSVRIERTIFKLRRVVLDDNILSVRKKIGVMLRESILFLFFLSILVFFWFCYFKYGDILSNGKNPDNYISVVKHFGGGDSTSSPASRFDVDPLPIIMLIALTIITMISFWYIRLKHLGYVLSYSHIPTAAKADDIKLKQSVMKDFKVYKDPQFSEVHDDLTDYLFIDNAFIHDCK